MVTVGATGDSEGEGDRGDPALTVAGVTVTV
jgi:hypothetical protein